MDKRGRPKIKRTLHLDAVPTIFTNKDSLVANLVEMLPAMTIPASVGDVPNLKSLAIEALHMKIQQLEATVKNLEEANHCLKAKLSEKEKQNLKMEEENQSLNSKLSSVFKKDQIKSLDPSVKRTHWFESLPQSIYLRFKCGLSGMSIL